MHAPGRWSVSPAYAINPVPEMDRVRMRKLAVTEDQEEPTIASALAAAPHLAIKASEAKHMLRGAFTAISGWRRTGRRPRLNLKPAFERKATSSTLLIRRKPAEKG